MNTIILCADDYAQSPAISSGILALARLGRLSAVSCFADSPHWPDAARRLAPFRDHVGIGLHLNLTHPFRPDRLPLGCWIRAAATRRIDAAAILEDFRRQLDAFVRHFGELPDFVDGHQHVHVFPMIRRAVFELLGAFREDTRPWVRSLFPLLPGQARCRKTKVLRLLSLGFDPVDAGLATNDGFGGIHHLGEDAEVAKLFAAWLATARDESLIMCHPGEKCDDPADPIAAVRSSELDYLSGGEFLKQLESNHLGLTPFGRRFSGSAPDARSIFACSSEHPNTINWSPPPRPDVTKRSIRVTGPVTDNEAARIALLNNAAFLELAADNGISRAQLLQAKQLPNPTLSVLFPLGPIRLEFASKFPLESLWLRPRKVKVAEFDAGRSEKLVTQGGLDLVRDVKLACVDLRKANRELALATESADLVDEVARLAEARFRAAELAIQAAGERAM
jgi:predicted glycoside hydrolase/deacetylase ChbG (UPF0249 family)